jgi:hypothetical protein
MPRTSIKFEATPLSAHVPLENVINPAAEGRSIVLGEPLVMANKTFEPLACSRDYRSAGLFRAGWLHARGIVTANDEAYNAVIGVKLPSLMSQKIQKLFGRQRPGLDAQIHGDLWAIEEPKN